MAFSDYGCLIKKNGVLLSEQETEDLTELLYHNSHGAIGTSDCFICVYKYTVKVVVNKECVKQLAMGRYGCNRKSVRFNLDGREVHIKDVTNKYKGSSSRFMITWTDKDGVRWSMLFGSGTGYWCKKWWSMMGEGHHAINSY